MELPLDIALKEYPEFVVTLASSQCLRFIDDINGVKDIDDKIRGVKRKIKAIRKLPRSHSNKAMMRELYNKLYELQFQPDYICIVMDSNQDYDRANLGFKVNGISYSRFLGTNGGIKNSTIVYINSEIIDELNKRLTNGRDETKEIVPAKLEAYQALICSGSTPLPQPEGIIVVNDCITHFKDDVILINDETDGEPLLTYEKDYEIEHNDSDGYGLMLPSYSKKVNEFLTGNTDTISGMNTRYAWTKGMVYTFDFIDFAENVAGTYEIVDAWGDKRDIRNAEIILTVSMLKLWDSYKSWEDYYDNCQKNGYQFSTPKITPDELENVRNTNYQFLQSYDFTDDELRELCKPTIDEIKDALGMDYRKSLVYLAGASLNENKVKRYGDNYIKALMIEKRLINDPFIRRSIHSMIRKRINSAKKGSISINANYAMISGDPYALCQSIFGMEITGLLKAGELYHKYWIDKGADELACFRAPMTCHNNIRKLKLNKSNECLYWYKYINTAIIMNAWDTACDAMNGADKDGDTNMDTDNPIIVKNTLNSPTIVCMQKKAQKVVPSKNDIIASNKLAFNDDIGTVTNYVTSMIEVQSGFDKSSEEYKVLDYRIMCGQHYQQATIDRAKGIIAKPMPEYWYNYNANKVTDDDGEKEINEKAFNRNIVANNKPYFMIYVYPNLKKKYKEYVDNSNAKSLMLYGKEVSELEKENNNDEFLNYYKAHMPVGVNACVVNRISWIFENEFNTYLSEQTKDIPFDYRILKPNVGYSKKNYQDILKLYEQYLVKIDNFHHRIRSEKIMKDDAELMRIQFVDTFIAECLKVCTNEEELCDIVLDICYQSDKSKQFAWDVCGETIVRNLLIKNDNIVHYPLKVETDGEFTFGGNQFVMEQCVLTEDDI